MMLIQDIPIINMEQEVIYLASPYSHPDPEQVEENYKIVSLKAAELCNEGLCVISPITYGHTLVTFKEMPIDFEFWNNFCLTLLAKCDKMIVYKMPGWDKSKGVDHEISFAQDMGIGIEFLDYK